MTTKEYYKILEITPLASPAVIKKAYRRLALKYHPDKNGGNSLYEQKFKEINEAYRTLSNPQKREHYNYSRTTGRPTHPKPHTEPASARNVFTQAKKLQSKIAAADPDRMNKEALLKQVEQLLSRQNVALLREAAEEKVNVDFVHCIFAICQHLPYSGISRIIFPLVNIAGTNNDLLVQIREFDKRIKFRSLWNNYKILVALIATFFFCLLIFWISQ